MTPYEVLGVDPAASDGEIRRAYLALARRFHPDMHPGGEERMRTVNQAWAILSDRERRAAWDRAHAGLAPDPGFRPDDPVDDGFDPRDLVDRPYRPTTPAEQQRRSALTVAPVAVFAAAAGTAFAGFFFGIEALIGLGVVLFGFACLGMIGVLLLAMVDARQDEG